MNARLDRVRWATQPSLIAVALWFVAPVAGQGRDIHRLDDFELFREATGAWEGVGVSFEFAPNGAIQPAVTYRDTWEASLAEGGRLMLMNGVTRSGGRRVEYVWRFRWDAAGERVTAEFENSLGESGKLDAKVLAEGRRLELSSESGMGLDIYLEDEGDLVIEIVLLDEADRERYRSAARYHRASEGGEKSKGA